MPSIFQVFENIKQLLLNLKYFDGRNSFQIVD